MSGEGPESIPTSADPRSKRPTKKRALTPLSAQAQEVESLFARPDQDIRTERPNGGVANSSRGYVPPEIVTNVQGSSAGAGSGEFHVYKASRRREYERLRRMDEEVAREGADADFERGKEERFRRDDDKTRRNREKRDKKRRAREQRAKNDTGAAADDDHHQNGAAIGVTTAQKNNNNNNNNSVKPRIPARTHGGDKDGEDQDAPDHPMGEAVGIVIEDD